MRVVTAAIGTALAANLALTPLYAAPGGPKAPKATKTASAPKAPKTTGTGQAKAPKAPKSTSASTKTTGPTKTAKTTKPVTDKGNLAKRSNSPTTSTASLTPTTSGPIDFTQGKVGEKLTRNSALRSKLEGQLKALGYEGTVYQAGYGFKNQGQLVAAINNAQNQQMPFEQLKTLMTGVSVDSTGTVLRANRNPDGTVTMLPVDEVTNPAPTQSLGQAKKTLSTVTTSTSSTQTVQR